MELWFALPARRFAVIFGVMRRTWQLLAVALGMASSKSEGRRLVEQGGVRLNDQTVRSASAGVSEADLDASGTARLTVGKKRHGLIRRG